MPSQNHSSRRQSSRGSSSRGSKQRGKAVLKKTAASDGVNFFATLIGFVCGLTLLLLVVSFLSGPKLNADILAANDENRADIATSVKKQDFDTFVENASVEKLAEILTSMNEKTVLNSESKFCSNYLRKQKILDLMMENPLSEEQRQLAVLTRIRAVGAMFWANRSKDWGEANLGGRLRELTETHKEDSVPEISFESRIQLFRLNSLDAANQVVPRAQEMHQLLADFPSDKRVIALIIQSFKQLMVDPERRNAVPEILEHFFKQPKVIGDKNTELLYSRFTDLVNLFDRDFFRVKENILYAGKTGRDQLCEVCLDLSRIPSAGIEIFDHVLQCASWLEVNDHYDHAIELYTALADSGKNLTVDDALKFKRFGKWGVRRCEAVGKPLDLTADMYDGEPFNLAAIKSMPVLIVFFAESDKTDRVLLAVEKASRRWQRGAVKILAVQVEKRNFSFDPETMQKRKEQLERWDFFYENGTATRSIFSQIPSAQNGRVVLLDRQHKIYDVNVAIAELVTTVNSVLSFRSEEVE